MNFLLYFSFCNVVIFYALHIIYVFFFLSLFLSFLLFFPFFLSLHTFCCLDAQERVSIKGEGVPTSTRYPNVTRQIDVASDKGCLFIRHPLARGKGGSRDCLYRRIANGPSVSCLSPMDPPYPR
jgi:hypothetical protein